jgi:peptidoglycan hydrolase-like protein with peptidoglycan-binding domain
MFRVWRTTISGVLVAAVGVVTPVALGTPASNAAPRLAPGSPASAITAAPVRPTHCTKDQIAAVDLDNCALMVDGTPNKHGFPEPPFPGEGFTTTPIDPEEWTPLTVGAAGPIVVILQEKLLLTVTDLVVDGKFGTATADAVKKVQESLTLEPTGIVDSVMAQALGILVHAEIGLFPGDGWVWNGNSWSGSPSLAAWESRMVKGTVRTDPLASGIFEGFLADIRRGTYRIDEAGTYSFRCTASTQRNCKGITTAQLSYHAWGLAVDLNYSTNPLQMVYHSSDACSAPTKHAIPDWVLKTAQHWGLFWGGWYSCPKEAGRRSVVKDPHHFEFRGTPETAAAIIAKNTGEGSTPFPVPELADLLLACGDRGAAVGQIRDLLPAGYRPTESASLRNTFTSTLAAALSRWQTDQGLPVTGTFDPATATALGVTVRHTEQFPVLHRNSCGEWVRRLQTLLGITPSGTIGTLTTSVLRTWQTKNGLAPTGVTDTSTAAALGLKLPAPDPPPTTTDPATTDPGTTVPGSGARVVVPLGLQARGSSVSALQRALTAAGFRTSVDGRFGSATLRSMRAFQRAKGLRVTTSVTLQTALALGLSPVPKLPIRSGQRGDPVTLLQQALRAQGNSVRVDGIFGAATRRAVAAFQRSKGLPATGVVGAATARALGW